MPLPKVRSLAKSMSAVLPAFLAINLAAAQESQSAALVENQPVTSIWTRVSTPDIGAPNVLSALSADSEQDVWAIGDFVSLRFDGTKWTAIVPVLPAQGESTLNGIAAVSPTDVWAVGSQVVNNTHLLSLIEHFDGTNWTIVPAHNLPLAVNYTESSPFLLPTFSQSATPMLTVNSDAPCSNTSTEPIGAQCLCLGGSRMRAAC